MKGLLLILLLYWIRALPDRPFRSQTRLIGPHSMKDTTGWHFKCVSHGLC